jgi:DNA-binding transcriptional LysR family regulator
MNLQIDYFRTFIALAEAKNFTKTGIQVNLSPFAVNAINFSSLITR